MPDDKPNVLNFPSPEARAWSSQWTDTLSGERQFIDELFESLSEFKPLLDGALDALADEVTKPMTDVEKERKGRQIRIRAALVHLLDLKTSLVDAEEAIQRAIDAGLNTQEK